MPQMYNLELYLLGIVFIIIVNLTTNTISKKIRGIYRIGPHNKEILSIIYGSLLGDAHAEKRLAGTGTRISFYQEASHLKYIFYLHDLLFKAGYCNDKLPIAKTRLGVNGKIRKYVRFHTWTYTSFDWIYDEWYANDIKRVPKSIEEYLTPLSLAIWIMSSWAKKSQGLRLYKPLAYEDCILLNKILFKKYLIESIVCKTSDSSKYVLFIKKEFIEKLKHIINPYIINSMKYKLIQDSAGTSSHIKCIGFQALQVLSLQSPHLSRSLSYLAVSSKPILSWFITGFSDAESSFMIFMNKNSNLKQGLQVQASFQIGLHKKDVVLLKMIQSYFKGVGNITKQNKDLIQYKVSLMKDLKIIVEHFENYPLITQKKADFELWKQGIELLKNKEHLTEKGLIKIANLKVSMNKGLSDELIKKFPNINPISRPFIVDKNIKDPNWLAGFVSGDGSFIISIFKSNTPTGYTVRLIFKITQHSRDIELMKSLVDYLGCGRYVATSGYNHGEFIVSNLPDIMEKIIPFFEKYPIIGYKASDFSDFCEAALIMKNKGHLTKEGLEKIIKIKEGMNLRREWE